MQSVRDYIHTFYHKHQKELESAYAGISSDILLKHFKNYMKDKDQEFISMQDQLFFDEVLQGTPLEYITGEKFFYRSPFYVNSDVLIPRNETEILVEDAINFVNKNYHTDFSIAEVGVGSFAIGLSILIDLEKSVRFWGGDISAPALGVAQTNLFKLRSKINKESLVELCLSDRLEKSEEEFDLIVSNPPYIRESDSALVHESVHSAEPHVALYLADDIYDKWFVDFFQDVNDRLNIGGAFFMEGHEDTLEEISKLAEKEFKQVELKKDYTGRLRFLHCYK